MHLAKENYGIKSEITSINDIIEKTVKFTLKGRKSLVEFSLDKDLKGIMGDQTQISQVIQNLILNADESTNSRNTIHVKSRNINLDSNNEYNMPSGEYIRIDILDSGNGINNQDKEKIFDLFYTTKVNGTGIGLAITKKIIEEHNGYIGFKSNEVNGSNFYFLLPAINSLKTTVKEDPFELKLNKNMIVVVYDDNEDIGIILEEMLKKFGAQTYIFKNSNELIQNLGYFLSESIIPEFFILDLILPGDLGGEELVSMIKNKFPDAYCIVSSGYSENTVIQEFKKFGFDDVLRKPYRMHELQNVLKRKFEQVSK